MDTCDPVNLSGYPSWLPSLQVDENGLLLHEGAATCKGAPLGYTYPYGAEKFELSNFATLSEALAHCIQKQIIPLPDCEKTWWLSYAAYGCTRRYTADDLKSFFYTGERLDNEEAASVVLSFLGPELAVQLLPCLNKMIGRKTALWSQNTIAPLDQSMNFKGSSHYAVNRIKNSLLRLPAPYSTALLAEVKGNALQDWIVFLSRIRSSGKVSHRLRIPAWLEKATGWTNETLPTIPDAEIIRLPMHHLRRISKWVLHATDRWAPQSYRTRVYNLHRRALGLVAGCSDRVAYDFGFLEPLLKTQDPLALAHGFIVFQRRLQIQITKLHADYKGTEDELQSLQQNQPDSFTSFQIALVELARQRGEATDWPAFSSVLPPPQSPNVTWFLQEIMAKDTMSLIIDCCLLMEEYVWKFGEGSMMNLGPKVTTSRGPIGSYNLLVVALARLCQQYSREIGQDMNKLIEEGDLPASCTEFAPRIYAHHTCFTRNYGREAFEPGSAPGWMSFLANLRAQNMLPQPEYTVKY